MLSEDDEHRYVDALTRSGFRGPNSWYVNDEPKLAYAARTTSGARLTMPVLFLHPACARTVES